MKKATSKSSFKNKQTGWILNAILVTQNESRSVHKGHLFIENGFIKKITSKPPHNNELKNKNYFFVDAKNHYLFPGFIQTHTHLCQTLFRNMADDLELLDWLQKKIWVFEAAHTQKTLETSAKLGVYELLRSGTTCILDMGTVRHTESILKVARKFKIRGSFGKCLMDHPETTPLSLRENTEECIEEAKSLFKKWNGAEKDRIRISFAPRFVVSCTEKLMKEVSRLSKSLGATIHTHASENLKEIELVKKLVNDDNVEYLNRIGMTSPRLVLAHCVWLKPHEKKILKKTGTHVAHCPSSNLKLASGIAPIPELKKMGINVSLGADGSPCNNNLNMFTEMRLAALIQKPQHGPRTMPAHEILDMATINGAKALNWFDQIGSIEIGKKADLICVDLTQPENQIPASNEKEKLDLNLIASALVYSTHSEHLKWTMIDGEMVYQNGKVKGLSPKQLSKEVLLARHSILKSIRQ